MALLKVGTFVGRAPVRLKPILGSSWERRLHDDANNGKVVRIGCSSGFWGDTATAVPQLLYGGNVQVNRIFALENSG